MNIEELKYPIGKFKTPENFSPALMQEWISVIESFPAKIKYETEALTDSQLDTPYRPEGWTIRQVVHHCADSHMNSLTRFKLALTEDKPTIKPYFEERWAELADTKTLAVDPALKMIEGIHARWAVLLKSLNQEQWKRSFIHPQTGREFTLEVTLALYAWHSNHHLAHITGVKNRMQW